MDADKHLIRLERTATRERGLNSHTSFRDHDLHEKSQRDWAENITKRNLFFRESKYISKKTFLEGEETGRKCSGCVQKDESDFAGKYIMARKCSAKKSSLLQTK